MGLTRDEHFRKKKRPIPIPDTKDRTTKLVEEDLQNLHLSEGPQRIRNANRSKSWMIGEASPSLSRIRRHLEFDLAVHSCRNGESRSSSRSPTPQECDHLRNCLQGEDSTPRRKSQRHQECDHSTRCFPHRRITPSTRSAGRQELDRVAYLKDSIRYDASETEPKAWGTAPRNSL